MIKVKVQLEIELPNVSEDADNESLLSNVDGIIFTLEDDEMPGDLLRYNILEVQNHLGEVLYEA